jgi:putative YhbY family RNA-binding protein
VKELDSAERRALRARAHALQPVVMLGEEGLKPSVIREINLALTSHELIKVRVMGDGREARESLLAEICDATGAQPVQTIGKVLVIYRPLPPEAKKEVKRRPGRKAPRKTKRSFQKT